MCPDSPWDAKTLAVLLEAVAEATQGLALALNPCVIFSVASLCIGSREAADSRSSAGDCDDWVAGGSRGHVMSWVEGWAEAGLGEEGD